MTFIEKSDKFERGHIHSGFFFAAQMSIIFHAVILATRQFKLRARYLADAQKAVRPCDKRAQKSTRMETPGPYVSPTLLHPH